MSTTVIRNGRIVTAVDDYTADILMNGGRVVAIGEGLQVGADTLTVDARALVVLPGGVDCHTHMENTFGDSTTCDTFASGTRSAAFGGTTTIVDFAFQRKDEGVLDAIASAQAKAQGAAVIDYSTSSPPMSTIARSPTCGTRSATRGSPASRCSWPIPAR